MKCPLQLLVWKVENKLLKHTSSAQAKRAYSWRNPGQCVCTNLRWHVFLCWVDWLSIIHIIANPGRQQWCADTCTCSSLKVSHFRYVLAWGTSVLLLSTASTGKYDLLFLSTLTCFFLSICQVIWTGCVVSHSLEWVLLIDWRLFPSYALRQNCWHIWPISSAWSRDFSLSPSRMTSSCVTSRQCVLCCVRFI